MEVQGLAGAVVTAQVSKIPLSMSTAGESRAFFSFPLPFLLFFPLFLPLFFLLLCACVYGCMGNRFIRVQTKHT